MLQSGYIVAGLAFGALAIVLWIVKILRGRKNTHLAAELNNAYFNSAGRDHDMEHRALMFLMAQKTDSVLAALALTIEQERQKLGVVVRNPSMTAAMDAFQSQAMPTAENRQSRYERIVPMAHSGMEATHIARQLQLPEAEVSLVLRLNAA